MNNATTIRYEVKVYKTGETVGHIDLTSEQFAKYESMSQQPQGIIALGDLPHDLYELDAENQDLPASTVVYLD